MSLASIAQAGALAAVLLGAQATGQITQIVTDELIAEYQGFYAEEWLGTCATGTNLSPIDVVKTEPAPAEWLSTFAFGIKTELAVVSTGHAMQMQWGAKKTNSTASVEARGSEITDLFVVEGELKTMKLEALQMHWHAPSEHAINGVFFAAEGHIVTAIQEGEAPAEWGCDKFWQTGNATDLVLGKCVAVFGVVYKLGETTEPPILATMIKNEPLEVKTRVALEGDIDLETMLPMRKDYITYRGSLTTPDCNEGLRWHLFDEPMTITAADQKQLMDNQAHSFIKSGAENIELLFKTNTQYIQAQNDRVVYRMGEAQGVSAVGTETAMGSSAAGLSMVSGTIAALAALAMYML